MAEIALRLVVALLLTSLGIALLRAAWDVIRGNSFKLFGFLCCAPAPGGRVTFFLERKRDSLRSGQVIVDALNGKDPTPPRRAEEPD